jgi:hypothetical protein
MSELPQEETAPATSSYELKPDGVDHVFQNAIGKYKAAASIRAEQEAADAGVEPEYSPTEIAYMEGEGQGMTNALAFLVKRPDSQTWAMAIQDEVRDK